MIRIPTATKSAKGRGIQLSAERLVNMYAEQAPEGAKSPIVVHGCPGLNLFGSVGEKIRGMYRTPADGKLYVVAAQSLFSIASDGSTTTLGTIAGFGRVGMADNGTELCIVTGARGYIYSVSDGLSVIDDRDFPGADTVTFIDGFFVFNNRANGQKGQFFISDLLDGTTYDALDFATAERYPDNLTRVFADHSELLLFGDESIEVWFNAGNADFPFSRAQGSVIEQGLGARWTVAKVDESVFWLDQEGIVRRLQGQTPLRISTHAIENAISKGDWTNATAYSYTDEGHQFYCLTIPAASLQQTAGTYCFDAATGLWHERQSYERDYSRVGFYARAFGKHIVGDIDNGNLYEMSLDFYDENGTALIAEMVFPQIQNDGDRFIVNKLQLDMDVGTTATEGGVNISYLDDWAIITDLIPVAQDKRWSAMYGNGIWLIGSDAGGIAYSANPLVEWSEVANVVSGDVWTLVFGDGVFVAAGDGGTVATSRDGANWTTRSTPTTSDINAGVYGDGVFVLVGAGDTIITSEDGESWTSRTVSGVGTIRSVWYDGSGRFVAIGFFGASAYSDDRGATWTTVSAGSTGLGDNNVNSSNSLTYGNGMWAYYTHFDELYKSTDGVTWAAAVSPGDFGEMLYFDGTYFVAGSYFRLAKSTDLQTWETINIPGWVNRRYSGWFSGDAWLIGGADKAAAISIPVTDVTPVGVSAQDPKIMLDVSGNTRTFDMTQGWRSIGKRGEYDTRVIWRRLGQHRSFTPRLAISSPVKRAVFAAYAEIEPCK